MVIPMYSRCLDILLWMIVVFECGRESVVSSLLSFSRKVVLAVVVSFSEAPRCPRASLGVVKLAKLYKSMITYLGLSHT